MTERDILHDTPAGHYVARTADNTYTVFRAGITHATSDSTYRDLSLAVARCNAISGVRPVVAYPSVTL